MCQRIRAVLGIIISIVVAATITPAKPALADCTASPNCKSYNQWSGGTDGAEQYVELNSVVCWTGCTWIEQGMWVKLLSTGNYIFTGVEETQTAYRYLYIVYKPSTGPIFFTQGSATPNTIYVKTQFISGNQKVSISGSGINLYQSTSVTDSLWDIVHTGLRINGIPNSTDVYTWKSKLHRWHNQSTNTWYYQTSDGSFQTTGGSFASNMYQSWYILPHEPNSQGGTYQNWCNPVCP